MLLVTSILIGALGAVARFQAAAEAYGFKMHALGVSLMVLAVVGVLVSLRPLAAQRMTRSLGRPVAAN